METMKLAIAILLISATRIPAQDAQPSVDSLQKELTERLEDLDMKYEQAQAKIRAEILDRLKLLADNKLKETRIGEATKAWEAVAAISPKDEEAAKFFLAIGRELKPPQEPEPKQSLEDKVLGRWMWCNGNTIDFLPDGKALVHLQDGHVLPNTWKVKSSHVLQFYEGKQTGKLDLNGTRLLEGIGSRDNPVWGVKIGGVD